jgi:hypothetical protein
MKKLELDISPDFTLEDIRKIRDYDYEMTKDMTREEVSAYYKERGKKAMKRYYDFLEKRNVEENIAADSGFEYKTKKGITHKT